MLKTGDTEYGGVGATAAGLVAGVDVSHTWTKLLGDVTTFVSGRVEESSPVIKSRTEGVASLRFYKKKQYKN